MSPIRRSDLVLVGVAVLLLVLDQLTKYWIVAYFTPDAALGAYKPPVSVLGDVLLIEYGANKGVAFSLLYGSAMLFFFIALALGVIGFLYWRLRNTASLLLQISFGLIVGGAFGNLLDRLTRGYVVDFIHVQIPAIHFDWPVFNVADSGICIGVVLLAFHLWRGDASAHRPVRLSADATPSVPDTTATQTSASVTDSALPRVRRRIETTR